MREPTSVDFINEVYESIASSQSSAQAIHLLKRFYQYYGTLDLPPTLYRHKLLNSSFLIHAVQQHNVPVVKFLLSVGVDTQFKHQSLQYTALWALCYSYHNEASLTLFKMLVAHGGIENHMRDFGSSLIYALLTTTHEYTQYTPKLLELILAEYNKVTSILSAITTPSIPSTSSGVNNPINTTTISNDNNNSNNNGMIMEEHDSFFGAIPTTTSTPTTPPIENYDENQYPSLIIPSKFLIGEIPFPYTLLPTSLQQFNNSQHESLKIPATHQNNVIELSLFHLILHNPSQLYFSIWIKQLFQVLLPYYCHYIISQSYESIYHNLFYFEQWLVNSLLSSHLASVESIMFVYAMDFYHYPTSLQSPLLTNQSSQQQQQQQLASSKPTTIAANSMIAVTVSLNGKVEHPLLVTGKMPYFDYIYTYLEHTVRLDSQGNLPQSQVYKGNLDSVLIIQLLLSLPSININNWQWDETKSNNLCNAAEASFNVHAVVQNSDNSLPLPDYPKLTRYEFSQLVWLLFYVHPRPSTIGITENLLKILFRHTYQPRPNEKPLISKQFEHILPLNENLYDPEGLYSYGPILSAFLHSNYQLPKSLLHWIFKNVTRFEVDEYTNQTPFSLDLFPSTMIQELQHVRTFNLKYPLRTFFLDYLHHGIRTFSKYDKNSIDFVKYIYQWLFYPFWPTTVPTQNIAVINQSTTNNLSASTSGVKDKTENKTNKKDYHYGELILAHTLSLVCSNTILSQYDSIQLVEYIFQLYTKDFSRISPSIFTIVMQFHFRSRRSNYFLLSCIYSMITKYQSNITNCPNYDRERASASYYTIFEASSWSSQTFHLTDFLENLFSFKKTKDVFFSAEHNSPGTSDLQFNTLSATQGLATAQSKSSSKKKLTSYEKIRNMLHAHVSDFCKQTIYQSQHSSNNSSGLGGNQNQNNENNTNVSSSGQFPFYTLRPDCMAMVFPRTSSIRSFLSGGDVFSTFNNPFVTEYSNELFLRLFLTDLLRYYQTKPLTQRILIFIVLMIATIIKPPVLSIEYSPNRPYREYLYSYNSSLYVSNAGSSSTMPGGPADGFTRRRGNVVLGQIPTPIRGGTSSGPGGGSSSPSSPFSSGFSLGGLGKGLGASPLGGNRAVGTMSSQRLKTSVLPSQQPTQAQLVANKPPCWIHYYNFAQRFQTLRGSNNSSTNVSQSSSSSNKNGLSVTLNSVGYDSPELSPTNSTSSQSMFKVRFVNQQKPRQPLTTQLFEGPDSSPPESPKNGDIQQGESVLTTPNEPQKPARKMLKASQKQANAEAPTQQQDQAVIQQQSELTSTSDSNIPKLLSEDGLFVFNKANSGLSLTTTTPTLVPAEDCHNSMHLYHHNYPVYRRAIFSSNLIESAALSNELGDDTKSRKSIVKSNTKRFEYLLSDPYEKQQLYALDLLFSFINSIFTIHKKEIASYGLSPALSPLITSPSNISGGSSTPGGRSGFLSPKLPKQANLDDLDSFQLDAPHTLVKNASGTSNPGAQSNVSLETFDTELLPFNGLAQNSYDATQHAALLYNPINPLPPSFHTGHVYIDVAHLFLHECSPHSIAMLTRLIENATKCPQHASLITAVPDPTFRLQAGNHYVPIHNSPNLIPPDSLQIGSGYQPSTYDLSPKVPYLNYLHWCSYMHDDNYVHMWRPLIYHPDVFNSPLLPTPPNSTNSSSQKINNNSSPHGDSTPSILIPHSSNHSDNALNQSSGSPSPVPKVQSLFINFASIERTHLPPFLALLWTGMPLLYNTTDFTTLVHSFPPQNPADAVQKAHTNINNSLNASHPNIFITHSRPGHKVPINIHFVQAFKQLMNYWATMTYQRYYWMRGDLSFTYNPTTHTHCTDPRTGMVSLSDTYTVQQQLLQSLYTPYFSPNHTAFSNPTLQPFTLPSIYTQIPVFFLFLSRFNPHLISPHLIEIINSIITQLAVPQSALGLINAQSDFLLRDQFSATGFSTLDQADSSLGTSQSFIELPTLTSHSSQPTVSTSSTANNRNSLSQSSGNNNNGIFSSLKSSFFGKKPTNNTSTTSTSLSASQSSQQPMASVLSQSHGNMGFDENQDEHHYDDIVLTPLNIISTTNNRHTHTMPLSSLHNDATTTGALGLNGKQPQQQGNVYIALLESVLFTEQRHHYQFFLTRQSSPYHQNSLLPLSVKSATSASLLSFNIFRFVNMFSFEFFTPLHMLLLPQSHPIKHQLLYQTQHRLDLPFTSTSHSDMMMGSLSTPLNLHIPSNNNWVTSTLYHHRPTVPTPGANPIMTDPMDKLILYTDNRNTLASLQRTNYTISLPISTLTPTNNHHPSSHIFTPYLFTLLCIFSAYGFDWNTSIISSLPNHFTSSNLTQFLDTTLGESQLGNTGGQGAITMNMMKTFESQKQSLFNIHTAMVATYLPPLFILQSHFQVNALFVSFFATLFGLQRYISHSVLHTSGFGILRNGKSIMSLIFPQSKEVETEDNQKKFTPQITAKPSKFPPTLLTPNDLQHQTVAPYQFTNELYSTNNQDVPIPMLQTLFTVNYGMPTQASLASRKQKREDHNAQQQFQAPEWTSAPSTYATNYPTLTPISANQYISSQALARLSLISTSTDGRSIPFLKHHTLLTLLLLRQDLSWDTNWLHLIMLYIQNGGYINYNNIYVNSAQQQQQTPSLSSTPARQSLLQKATQSSTTASSSSSPTNDKWNTYTNDILIHLLSGHNNRHSRHLVWFKAIALMLSSGCNLLFFNSPKNATTQSSTVLSSITWPKSQFAPTLPGPVLQLKNVYFSSQEQNGVLTTLSTLGQWLPSYQQVWSMVLFYHQQGFMQPNHKYPNITTALLFHPRVEMRKYWFEPFKLYYNIIFQPWALHNATSKQKGRFLKKITGKDASLHGIERLVPTIIHRLFMAHPILLSNDLINAFTPRSPYNNAVQTSILSYFSTLPFHIFSYLHQYVMSLLHLYNKEMSSNPPKHSSPLHEENVNSVFTCISRSLVDLNRLPNILPHQRTTQLYNCDNLNKPLSTGGTSDDLMQNAVKLHVNDIPQHPYLEYESIFGSAANASVVSSTPSTPSKSSTTLNGLFEAPSQEELNYGTVRHYFPDGTNGLIWYILNNCYPHSKYLPTSFILQDYAFNPSLYSKSHIGSIESTSTDDGMNLDEDALTSGSTIHYSKPADLTNLPHDLPEFVDYIINEYHSSGESSSATPFTSTSQLNQTIIQHALLRRLPEESLFVLTNMITGYNVAGSTGPKGLDQLFTQLDFNGYSFLDYLYYCQIESYAPNYVAYIAEYYFNTYQGKAQQLEDKFATFIGIKDIAMKQAQESIPAPYVVNDTPKSLHEQLNAAAPLQPLQPQQIQEQSQVAKTEHVLFVPQPVREQPKRPLTASAIASIPSDDDDDDDAPPPAIQSKKPQPLPDSDDEPPQPPPKKIQASEMQQKQQQQQQQQQQQASQRPLTATNTRPVSTSPSQADALSQFMANMFDSDDDNDDSIPPLPPLRPSIKREVTFESFDANDLAPPPPPPPPMSDDE